MNRCGTYKRLISQYIDEELDANQREELELHLADCADCRDILDSYRIIQSGVKTSSIAIQSRPEAKRGTLPYLSRIVIGRIAALGSAGLAAAALIAVLILPWPASNGDPRPVEIELSSGTSNDQGVYQRALTIYRDAHSAPRSPRSFDRTKPLSRYVTLTSPEGE